MPKAKYEQLYLILKEKIESGTYPPQEMLPSEHMLIEELGCSRNTLRRVEVAAPVYDPALQRRLANIFDVMWRDNRQARDQQPDGSYVRRMPNGDAPLACQDWLYDEAYRTAHRLPAHAE